MKKPSCKIQFVYRNQNALELRADAALTTLSDFFETFGFIIPDALLRRRSSGVNSRQRRFTLHVTFWAFLAQTLAPETSCRDVVRKVQAWWLLRAPDPPPPRPPPRPANALSTTASAASASI